MFGANELDVKDIEALFASNSPASPQEGNTTPTPATEEKGETDPGATANPDVTATKAFAKRLKESTEKAVNDEREKIAKSMGYDSYAAMVAANENKVIAQKGLDPDQVAPIVDELVKKRIDNDPRMLELEGYRKREAEIFAQNELAEIAKLTDGEITKLEQLPPEVVELWKSKGSLKAAYLEAKGEDLVNKLKAKQNRGTTAHLNTATGTTPATSNTRPLTPEEIKMYKFFNPNMTDEELSKITRSKE